MKATLNGKVIAESDDIVENSGYRYFPPASVRMEFLRPAPKSEADQRCPHSVQFFDLCDGAETSPRAAWAYQAPRPSYAHVAQWIGFWNEVDVQP